MDSPKCHNCLNAGILSQTYKLAGRASYKCQVCKSVIAHSEFKAEEFTWKDDFAKWKGFMETRIKEKSKSLKDLILKDMNKLEKVLKK